ncbi:MAG: type II secretion system GspH family protein [Phycisphaerae bacterium]|nr:type II secretion system GspH family protein [Phycisphaerae bacterium]
MKPKSRQIRNNGFTLIEIAAVIVMVGMMTLGAGVLLANGQKSWGRLFGRVYGDQAIDSFAAQKAFDAVCRKASLRKYVLNGSGNLLELYYWDGSSTASTPEHYARFYQSGEDMFVEYGSLETGTWQPDTGAPVTTVKLAGDVDSLTFTVEGTSVQMFLNYIDENMMPVVCSSVRHND